MGDMLNLKTTIKRRGLAFAAGARPATGRLSFRSYWKNRYLYLLLVPGLAALALFSYTPMYGILIAFKDFRLAKGIFGSPWADSYGLKYFIETVRLPGIRRAVVNSIVFSLYQFGVGFPAVIIFALLVNELQRSAVKRAIQTISYLPHFLSWVVVSGLVINVLSPSYGIVNRFLFMLTGHTQYFLAEPVYFRTVVIFSGLWKEIGWGSIIYLAMIAGANPELYEAARVDGAGRIRQAIHVTLPAMYPAISIGLIFALSGILQGGDFEAIFNLVNSITLPKGEVISLYIYRVGIGQFEYSLGTALGLLNSLIGLLLLFIANRVARYVSEYALW